MSGFASCVPVHVQATPPSAQRLEISRWLGSRRAHMVCVYRQNTSAHDSEGLATSMAALSVSDRPALRNVAKGATQVHAPRHSVFY